MTFATGTLRFVLVTGSIEVLDLRFMASTTTQYMLTAAYLYASLLSPNLDLDSEICRFNKPIIHGAPLSLRVLQLEVELPDKLWN